MFKWNRKVSQRLIADLYAKCAAGVFDEDLVDEVGCALYARCESIITVTETYERKTLVCPVCGSRLPLESGAFTCACGYHDTWEAFRASYKNKQLYAANALPIFKEYVKKYPHAKTYADKIICVDVLIHAFHIKNLHHNPEALDAEMEDITDNTELNRPTGANLIEGSLYEVVRFLNSLSSIEGISGGKEVWRGIAARANGGHIL